MLNYEKAMEYIHGTLKFGSKLGLETISKLLELMGNPHQKLKFVHVAGTNGKGSTTAFISSILTNSGYKTGMFISPFIQRFTERIQIDNHEILPEQLSEIISFVKEKIDIMIENGYSHPTEFEIITAVAFEHFYREQCDIAVMEVGLGGRYDSTNVIEKPEVAVITTISLDHTDRLGSTLAEIAYQKAGIMKPGCDAVLYPQKREAEEVFEKVAREVKACLHKIETSTLQLKTYAIDGQTFDYKEYKDLTIQLLGDHQLFNAAVAIDAAELLKNKGFAITSNTLKKGLMATKWPGRLEIINRDPLILIDGAHNFEGAKSLNEALDKYFPDQRKIFVTGFLRDKEYDKIMEMLSNKAEAIITVTPGNERAIPSAELAAILRKYSLEVVDGVNVKKALKLALEYAGNDGMVCVFGSLYMIGEIRALYKV